MCIYLCLEGNIGSGKTTLVEKLCHAFPHIPVYPERVETWKFLKLFYQNPAQYALTLQLEIMFSFAEAHANPGPLISERSTGSGYYCFAARLEERRVGKEVGARGSRPWLTKSERRKGRESTAETIE